jgi:rhodanese-related sulfurtransferase
MFGFFSKDTAKTININDIDRLDKNAVLIDIREPYEFKSGSLKKAKNIPMGELLNEPEKYLKKDGTYYIFCLSGARSSRASSYLSKQGYDVVNLSGGIGAYAGTMRT